MKKTSIIFLTIIFSLCSSFAQSPQIKKAAQAVFSLNTFRADGTLISTSHGVFINTNGEAISQWKPFVGAAKAVVIDALGKKYDVEGLIGANDLYDVCKFQVTGATPSAVVANTTTQTNGQLFLACYAVKSQRIIQAKVSGIETFSSSSSDNKKDYPFYILDVKTPEDIDYCPLFNSNGEVAGLLQPSSKAGSANAVSALFASDLQLEQIGTGAATLATSNIPSILPAEYKDAQVALILASQQRKPEAYNATIDLFIKKFPTKADGYQARARKYTAEEDFKSAAADMEKAISIAEDKAEAHNAYSELILDKEIYMSDVPYEGWSLGKALNEAKAAFAVDSNPVYKLQEGKVLYAQKKYDEACQLYLNLQETRLAGPETMYSATQCKIAADAPIDDIMMLMDSTIAVCPHPLTYQSAPYIFHRGMIYQDHGIYRKAWQEYNQYEKLMVGNKLPAEFYYNRFVCEREARVYQQALEDIQKAIDINPNIPMYHCEQGSFFIRMKKYDEAIASANQALILDSRVPEAYAILGVAQCSKGQKHEGLLNLEQAKDLGYEGADNLISKYK